MSNDVSVEAAVDDVRDHRDTIDSLTVVMQSLTLLDRDTREIELEVHELIDRELRDMGYAIDRLDNYEAEEAEGRAHAQSESQTPTGTNS